MCKNQNYISYNNEMVKCVHGVAGQDLQAVFKKHL
jgi:hypothetical protein